MSEESTDKTRLIPLPEAAKIYGFEQRYLTSLARRGRLKARKLGIIWVTTPADMEEYIRSRQKRGAFREDIQVD